MIFLEGFNADYSGVFALILIIMFLPSIILGIIGAILYFNEKKRTAKILFILAIVYVVISLGICGSMIMT